MIYTVTLNPSLDYLLTLDSFEPGALNRTLSDQYLAGGKGINVAQVLHNLGTAVRALGFTGGFTGLELERLLHEAGVTTDFIRTAGNTRVNVKLRAGEETEVNAAGPSLSPDQFEQLKEQLGRLGSGDTLVLSGSVPTSLPGDTYEQLAAICVETGCRFTVDAEGDSLLKTLPYRPLLVKPNHHELGAIVGAQISTPEEAVRHAQKLLAQGAEQVIVSLAGAGAVYVSRSLSLMANAPEGTVRGSVGAGDSMVAGFLAAVSAGRSAEDAFRFAVASGSATAFSDCLCTEEQVLSLLPHISVTQLEGGNGQ
ncbi:1-phosphofructokinase [Sporosarcina sp. NCCP-2716]|uniref:1-phosphofructokinase n=1 Tax=Sporosarcina sp. NCCP-2716 TaxID=2943679 RepID=UPI00203A8150|nr:1-phosphofructokinase [Sporosarcina sp. NCCP-2716]GKV70049.1 1-phosphofructokinase [Sporosarcina sp. NCCP-2716]